jgi:hypothetical protein
VTGPTGLGDTGVTFDGSTGEMTAATALTAGGGNTFTVEVWFKSTSSASGKAISATSVGGTNGYGGITLNYPATGKVSFDYYAAGDYLCSTTAATFNDGKWHLADYTVNLSGGNGPLLGYIDGAQVCTVSIGNGPSNIDHWYYGAAVSGGSLTNFFPGSETQATLYATTLSGTRIAAHYNATIASVAHALFMGPF